MAEYRIELLSRQHDVTAFACGQPELDRYLRERAGQDARRAAAVPYALCRLDDPTTVLGFYTLSAGSIQLASLPPAVAHRLARYPQVPAVLLGRFAVDQRCQGQGLGTLLLLDALRRSWQASTQLAIAVVVVDAKDEAAVRFYEHYGFQRDLDQALRLFLPLRVVEQLLNP